MTHCEGLRWADTCSAMWCIPCFTLQHQIVMLHLHSTNPAFCGTVVAVPPFTRSAGVLPQLLLQPHDLSQSGNSPSMKQLRSSCPAYMTCPACCALTPHCHLSLPTLCQCRTVRTARLAHPPVLCNRRDMPTNLLYMQPQPGQSALTAGITKPAPLAPSWSPAAIPPHDIGIAQHV